MPGVGNNVIRGRMYFTARVEHWSRDWRETSRRSSAGPKDENGREERLVSVIHNIMA